MQKMLRMRRASERRAVLALRKKQQSTTVPAHVSCYSNQGLVIPHIYTLSHISS